MNERTRAEKMRSETTTTTMTKKESTPARVPCVPCYNDERTKWESGTGVRRYGRPRKQMLNRDLGKCRWCAVPEARSGKLLARIRTIAADAKWRLKQKHAGRGPANGNERRRERHDERELATDTARHEARNAQLRGRGRESKIVDELERMKTNEGITN